MEIQWADPSPEAVFRHENKGGKYVEFALALREHQGKWAILPEGETGPRAKGSAQNMAQNMRRGQVKGFTKDEYEVILDDSSGEPLVHVRYVGPPEAVEPAEEPEDPDDDEVDPAEVRAWAKEHGVDISPRGRIGREVLQGYLKDRRDRNEAAQADLGNEKAAS